MILAIGTAIMISCAIALVIVNHMRDEVRDEKINKY